MVRAMASQKVVEKMTIEEQKDMLGLQEIVEGLAKASGVRW